MKYPIFRRRTKSSRGVGWRKDRKKKLGENVAASYTSLQLVYFPEDKNKYWIRRRRHNANTDLRTLEKYKNFSLINHSHGESAAGFRLENQICVQIITTTREPANSDAKLCLQENGDRRFSTWKFSSGANNIRSFSAPHEQLEEENNIPPPIFLDFSHAFPTPRPKRIRLNANCSTLPTND